MTVSAIIAAGAAVSAAYWTDETKLSTTVNALDIGIAYAEEQLTVSHADQFLPGDRSPLSFSVQNRGAVSVDIKPVIKIHTSEPVKMGEGYQLTSDTGETLNETFDVTYYNGDKENKTPQQKPFDTVVYTAKAFTTLAGSVQQDESLDRDEASGKMLTEKPYQYALELQGTTGNGFMNADAQVEVSTHAIQHRNTEGIRNDNSWMQTTKPDTAATPSKAIRTVGSD